MSKSSSSGSSGSSSGKVTIRRCRCRRKKCPTAKPSGGGGSKNKSCGCKKKMKKQQPQCIKKIFVYVNIFHIENFPDVSLEIFFVSFFFVFSDVILEWECKHRKPLIYLHLKQSEDSETCQTNSRMRTVSLIRWFSFSSNCLQLCVLIRSYSRIFVIIVNEL